MIVPVHLGQVETVSLAECELYRTFDETMDDLLLNKSSSVVLLSLFLFVPINGTFESTDSNICPLRYRNYSYFVKIVK